jgi:hypothetical protein
VSHRCRRLAAIVFVIASVSSAPAWAQRRTDVITLLNGDRITGEIMKLDRGRLEIKTDDAGTIDVEWEKVAAVQATRQFEVAASDGRRFLGSLGHTGERRLVIAGPDGTTTLTMPEVTQIAPIGASFWARLDGSFDGGFNYTRSSGIAQTTLNSKTVFRRPSFAIRLDASATLTQRSDEDQRDDQGAVELSYARFRGRRWFVSGAGRFESNESLGLTLRSLGAVAVGARLVNTNRAQLELAGGLVGNQEQGVDTESTRNVEGLLGLRSSYYTYDHPKTNVDTSLQYYPSLSTWGRQRLQVDSSIKREMWRDFYVGFNGYYTLDTAPPNPAARKSDVGLALTVGWTY